MKAGLTACSNGQQAAWEPQIGELRRILSGMGVETEKAEHLYAQTDDFAGTDRERAEDLMRFFRDDSVDAIFDISGGDLANGVLKYLDYEEIARTAKRFWGYSDLTTVINAIYAKTGKESVLYQVKNMVFSKDEHLRKRFADYISGKNSDLFDIRYDFLQGNSMEGVVVGGNIRCFLKLAGTEYWPDVSDKILLLESLGGESGATAAAFAHLEQLGVFDRISGVLLGTFTRYEEAVLKMSVFDLLKMHISEALPVAKTSEIGHGSDSKAIVIGRNMHLRA